MEAFLTVGTVVATVIGTLLGVIVGMLPGLSSSVGVAMLLPFTFGLSPGVAIALLLGMYVGSTFGGSISAILVNTPGTPAAAATALDGFPMARRGEAEAALAWATLASFIGGTVALLLLTVAAPAFAQAARHFGPIETFALTVFALTCIAAVSSGALVKGITAGLIGLLLTVVGQDPVTGAVRFTFGIFELSGGIGLLPVLIGVFAMSEVMCRVHAASQGQGAAPDAISVRRWVLPLPRLAEIAARRGVLARSSLVGLAVGILPGAGSATASFVSYALARRTSPRRTGFGKGEADGVIASEAANNAVTAGALAPTLALGIPGDPVTAVMLGTLVVHGIMPGPRLFDGGIGTVHGIYLVMLISNVAMLAIGLLCNRLWSFAGRAPEGAIMALVGVLSVVGAYAVNNSALDVLVMVISGLVGFVLRSHGYPMAPVVIGMVLGPVMERSLRQGLIITNDAPLQFFASPVAALFFALAGVAVLGAIAGSLGRKAHDHQTSQ